MPNKNTDYGNERDDFALDKCNRNYVKGCQKT